MKRAAALALFAAACTAPRPAPPPAVRAASAADLLPPDLDAVVRIDWRRLRGTALEAPARDALLGRTSAAGRVVLTAALARARAVYVGTRWVSDGYHGDGVIVLEGELGEVDPASGGDGSAWRALPAPANGSARYVPRAAPVERKDAAEVLVLGDRALALATAAEVDAVERAAQDGPPPGAAGLQPPAEGLASFAGRLRGAPSLPFARGTMALRRAAEGLERLSGTVEVTDRIAVSVALVYDGEARAVEAAAEATKAFASLAELGGAFAGLAQGSRVEARGELVDLRLRVPFELLVDPPKAP